ncbi:MAG TPA: DUF3300 domain-containing protein [Terriglobales bacterium]|nr:DUF3300 domain-containing protein [Terriglobales bacterium]
MNIFGRAAGFSRRRLGRPSWVSLLSLALTFATLPLGLSAQDAQAPPPQDNQAPAQGEQAPPYAQQSPEQLQRLVAPIALYPDSLVAQILAASTFPEEIVEADRWVQQHPDLKSEALGQAVDQQPWDPSVKALAAFPSVLGNMDKNLSWTSSLGDAYYNQQQDVMDAVQVMRHKAEQAGSLKTTPQEVVRDDGPDVDIEPADPNVVYVPAYNPWLVYGYPVVAWPGWYPYPGIWFGGPYLNFGVGFGIGWYGGFGWGWGHWGFDWHHRYARYNGGRYYSRSSTFYNRSNYYRGAGGRGGVNRGPGGVHPGVNAGNRPGNMGARGGVNNRPGAPARPFNGNRQAARGYAEPRGQSGVRSGAFSGYGHGGQAKSYSSRGSASVGGGAAHGGGGGTRGGGGSHGGGRH